MYAKVAFKTHQNSINFIQFLKELSTHFPSTVFLNTHFPVPNTQNEIYIVGAQ